MAGPSPATEPELGASARRRFVTVLLGTAIWGVVLFACAGRLDWWRGWIQLGLFALCLMANWIVVRKKNPEVIAHRGMKHKDTKPFDRIITLVYTVLTLVTAAVGGLDSGRFGHSTGSETLYIGAVLFLAGNIPSLWAMVVNPFLETTVRIQTERRHRVIASGPYQFVRHPMYVGIMLQNLAAPLILGSNQAFVPAALSAALFVVRTGLEDGTLRRELAGYEEFTQHTRYRLIPGIW